MNKEAQKEEQTLVLATSKDPKNLAEYAHLLGIDPKYVVGLNPEKYRPEPKSENVPDVAASKVDSVKFLLAILGWNFVRWAGLSSDALTLRDDEVLHIDSQERNTLSNANMGLTSLQRAQLREDKIAKLVKIHEKPRRLQWLISFAAGVATDNSELRINALKPLGIYTQIPAMTRLEIEAYEAARVPAGIDFMRYIRERKLTVLAGDPENPKNSQKSISNDVAHQFVVEKRILNRRMFDAILYGKESSPTISRLGGVENFAYNLLPASVVLDLIAQ